MSIASMVANRVRALRALLGRPVTIDGVEYQALVRPGSEGVMGGHLPADRLGVFQAPDDALTVSLNPLDFDDYPEIAGELEHQGVKHLITEVKEDKTAGEDTALALFVIAFQKQYIRFLDGDGEGTDWPCIAQKYVRRDWPAIRTEGNLNAEELYPTIFSLLPAATPLTLQGEIFEGLHVLFPAEGDPSFDRYIISSYRRFYRATPDGPALHYWQAVATHDPAVS